jgi:hypothetical protein
MCLIEDDSELSIDANRTLSEKMTAPTRSSEAEGTKTMKEPREKHLL